MPDSPESVALALFAIIIERETERARNEVFSIWALDLFAECLAAVRGDRSQSGQRRH